MSEFISVSANSQVTYLSAADLADRAVEGTYLGIVTGQFGPNYKIKTNEGTVIVNGSASLNRQFDGLQEGLTVRLEYKGKEKIKSGNLKGKTFHNIDVQYKPANTEA